MEAFLGNFKNSKGDVVAGNRGCGWLSRANFKELTHIYLRIY